MAKGINKVILVGNLGRDPEVRYTSDGSAVTTLNIATSESWKDQQGQQQERTEWHKVVLFGRLAQIAADYVKKGSQVYVEGKLQTRKWQDQNGQDRYSTEIVGQQMQMLGSRPEYGSKSEPMPPAQHYQQPSQLEQQNYRNHNPYANAEPFKPDPSFAPATNYRNGYQQQQQQAQQPQGNVGDDWSDEIPF